MSANKVSQKAKKEEKARRCCCEAKDIYYLFRSITAARCAVLFIFSFSPKIVTPKRIVKLAASAAQLLPRPSLTHSPALDHGILSSTFSFSLRTKYESIIRNNKGNQ